MLYPITSGSKTTAKLHWLFRLVSMAIYARKKFASFAFGTFASSVTLDSRLSSFSSAAIGGCMIKNANGKDQFVPLQDDVLLRRLKKWMLKHGTLNSDESLFSF